MRILGAVLTLALGVLSAKYFGTSAEKDCYLVAQTIPGLITMFLIGGVYSTLLILLTEIGRREGLTGQIVFARRTVWNVTLVLTPFVAAAMFFPQAIVTVIAPGFSPEQVELGARLLRITSLGAVGSVCFALTRCLFETRLQFIVPGLVSLVIPLASLGVLTTLVGRSGIFALALGPLVGTLLALLLLASLLRTTLRDPPGFIADPGAHLERVARSRRFWLSLIPMTISANSGQVNLLIDNAFASHLPTGSITMLGFAFVIVSNAELLTISTLAEVAFPRLTAAVYHGPTALAETLRSNLRYMILLTAPLSVGALTFGAPLVRLLFERGAFGAESTPGVAKLLACYSPEILFMGYVVLFSRVLFARKRFALAAWTSGAAVAANTALDYVLMKRFGVYGIAVATSCVTLLHLAILAPMVRKEVPAMRIAEDSRFALKVLACAAGMGILVLVWTLLCEQNFDTSTQIVRAIEVAVGLALGGASYVVLLHALRVEEARAVVKRLLTLMTLASWR